MIFEFDPAKDAANIVKHDVSLSAAADLEIQMVVRDDRRDYGEDRFNAFGTIGGAAFALTFTRRDGKFRAISLRRAHRKELRRYGI